MLWICVSQILSQLSSQTGSVRIFRRQVFRLDYLEVCKIPPPHEQTTARKPRGSLLHTPAATFGLPPIFSPDNIPRFSLCRWSPCTSHQTSLLSASVTKCCCCCCCFVCLWDLRELTHHEKTLRLRCLPAGFGPVFGPPYPPGPRFLNSFPRRRLQFTAQHVHLLLLAYCTYFLSPGRKIEWEISVPTLILYKDSYSFHVRVHRILPVSIRLAFPYECGSA